MSQKIQKSHKYLFVFLYSPRKLLNFKVIKKTRGKFCGFILRHYKKIAVSFYGNLHILLTQKTRKIHRNLEIS